MTGLQLRNSILQEAIQGHLVPNVLQPGEKTGEELLKDILAKRQKKENEEKGKKAKKLTLSTIEEEPWELPEGWCWCRVSDLCDLSDAIKKSGEYVNMDAAFLRGRTSGTIVKSGKFVQAGARMILVDGENSGEVFIAPCDGYLGSTFKELSIFSNDSAPYLLLFLAFNKGLFRNNKKGAAIPHLNKDIFRNLAIPFPPLSIQQRIVEKIEELLPLIDEYDKAAVELETLNKILPDKLRKSVLQEAIHGTLVPNDIPEGEATAQELLQQIIKERQEKENKEKGKKAKKLTLSTIEEEPWELPKGWRWCFLEDVVHPECPISYGIVQPGNNVPGGIPVIRPVDMTSTIVGLKGLKRVSPDISSSYKRTILRGGELLMCVRGTTGLLSIASRELAGSNVTRGIVPLFFPKVIERDFVRYALSAPTLQQLISELTKGAALKQINIEDLRKLSVPLPPLSIQHRIVEKIEEVFSAIDKLKV